MYSPFTVLEVNTVSLRLIAFTRSDDFFRSVASIETSYAGISDNKFLKPDQLFSTIINMFTELNGKIKYLSNKVYVSLPQSFIHSNVAQSDVAVLSKQVKQSDVDNLCKKCDCNDANYTITDYTPITFKSLNYPVMFNPIGQSCDKLYGKIACVSMEKRSKEFFDAVAKSLKKSFTYAGESNAVIDKLDRDLNIPGAIRLLVNIRDELISVCLCKGKAIVASQTVEWGANHVYYALQDLLKIKLPLAKNLAKKLNLNVNCAADDIYVINDGDNLLEYNMKAINDRVAETLVFIADSVKKAISSFKIEGALPIYITGSDVCMIRGVKEIFTNGIGGEMIDILSTDRVNYDTAKDYVLIAQLEKILNEKSKAYGSFLTKLWRI